MANTVWIPVLPSLKGFAKKVEGEARTAAKAGGGAVSDEFGKAGDAAGKSVADGLKRQSGNVTQASKKLADARTAEVNASGKVAKAEQDLENIRQHGDASASKVAKAEESLATAKRNAEAAGTRLSRAESDLDAARNGGEASSRTLASAEDRLTASRNKLETSQGAVRVNELKVGEARELSQQRSATLEAAEQHLSQVRDQYGEDSREAAAAERQVETARKQSETAANKVIDAETRLAKSKADVQSANESVAASSLHHKAVQQDLAAAEEQAGAEAADAAKDISGLGDEMEGAHPKSEGLAGSLGSLAKKATLAAGAFVGVKGIGDTISAGFDKTMAIEDTTASLEVLMGSADEATHVMDELTESNMKTPYSFDTWSEAGKNLIAFGVDADKVSGIVTGLGEAAAASGKGESALQSMSDAFGKAAASGKISMETINSLSEGGVNGLQILANQAGVSTDEMQKMISAGTVPAGEAIDTLTKGIIEGSDGVAGATSSMSGVMDEMSQTTSGQLGLLKMSFVNLAADIMGSLAPAISDLAQKGSAMLGWVRDFIADFKAGEGAAGRFRDALSASVPILKVAGVGLAALATGMVAYNTAVKAQAVGSFVKDMIAMSKAQKIAKLEQMGLNTAMWTSPITWIVAAIAGLVIGLTLFFTKTETGKKIWQGLMNVLSTAWDWIKSVFGPVFSWLGDVIGAAWDGIKGYFEWGWNNLKTVFGYISDGWQVVWGGIQTAWEAVGKPVVEFLVQYFQQAWENLKTVFEFIGQAWSVLWDGVTTAWDSVIKPVLDALWTVVSTTLGVIGTVILAPLLIAWNALSTGISWAWENLIKPAWDNLSTVITWLWNSVLMPIFGFIGDAWNFLASGIAFYWENVIKPAWDAVSTAATWLWNNVLSPVFTWISDKWADMSRGIQVVWESVIKPVWDALGQVISFVVENVAKPAFQALKDALSSVGDFFSSIVDGIKGVWNSLKSALAKPINFMINTVYNGGILKAWNTVAKFIPGLNQASPLSGIAENATGGAIRGPGTGTSDDILSWLSNGEHVLTDADVKALGGQSRVYALRSMIQSDQPFSWDGERLMKTTKSQADNGPMLPAFAKGGDINDGRPAWEAAVEKGHEWAQQQNGKPYLTGSQWPAGGDCSGFMSAIASVILGQEPNAGHWATPAFPAGQGGTVHAGNQTWDPGLSQGFSIGVKGGPDSGGQNGHTAGTLSSAGNFSSVNVESGGGHGGVAYGGPAAGADSGQFPGVWHLPIGADGDFESAGSVSPAKKKQFLRDKVKGVFDKILSPIDGMFSSMVGDPPPEWFGIPPKAMHGSKDKIVDFLFDRIEDLGNLLGKAYDSAKKVGEAIGDVAENIGKSTLHVLSGGRLFDTGGMLQSGGTAVNRSGKPERILSPDQTQSFEDLLEILPALMAGVPSLDAQDVLSEVAAAFGEDHPDVAGEVMSSMSDDALDFFGLKGTWMTDPSALGVEWGDKKQESTAPSAAATATTEMPASTPPVPVDDSTGSPLVVDLDEVDPHRHDKPEGPAGYVFGIVQAAQDEGLPASGARIGVATALVESGDPLQMFANNSVPESLNYPHDAVGSDYDSVGLFQQRDNGAWGTVAQRMDPHDSAMMFFDAMLQKFPNWQSMDPGAVAQGVQVSAFPDRYATKMDRAEELVEEAGLYDKGGILPSGALAVNLSKKPEHVFTDNAMTNFVDATDRLIDAADDLSDVADGLTGSLVEAGPASTSGPSTSAPADGHTATSGVQQTIVMENVQTVDPQAAAREIARGARRALAALK